MKKQNWKKKEKKVTECIESGRRHSKLLINLHQKLQSHFSYHKHIVNIMEKNIPDEPIVPVMVEDMFINESDV